VDSRHHVGLVVSDSARDDAAVILNRLERLGVPKLNRVDRLHVVVLIQQKLAAARTGHLGIEGRHPARLQRLDTVGVAAQALREPVSGWFDGLRSMVGDAREGAELFQLFDEPAGVLFDVCIDGAGRDHSAIVSPA